MFNSIIEFQFFNFRTYRPIFSIDGNSKLKNRYILQFVWMLRWI